MASTVYGLEPDDIRETELAYMQDVNASLLSRCITDAATDFNLSLSRWVEPASIEGGAYPDDLAWVRKVVRNGAAAYYGLNSTGSYEGFDRFIGTFNGALEMLRNEPMQLAAYRAGKDQGARAGALTSHASDMTDEEVAAARRGMLDPNDRAQWETT